MQNCARSLLSISPWRKTVFAIAVALAFAGASSAQAPPKFPTKSVRLLVGFSPGSATDITARMIGPKLSEMWGQSVIIENRSGAGSTLANATVAQATPDGHTLLVTSASFVITSVLQKKLPYDILKDFRGVTQIGTTTGVLVVAPSLGIKSVKELIARAKEKPDSILFGSTGPGSGVHLTTERFNMAAGIKVVHVPYKGQPEMILDTVTGRIHYCIPGVGSVMNFIKDGRLLPIAVAAQKRSPLLPNVAAMSEVLPGFERDAAHSLYAPARTPPAIIHQISKDVARVLELPDIKDRMQSIGFEAAPTTPEELDRITRNQIQIFTKVSKAVGLIN